MALKSTELTRAEYLTDEERASIGIDEGLVVAEIRNPDLRKELKAAKTGYVAYLKSLGNYLPDDGTWSND